MQTEIRARLHEFNSNVAMRIGDSKTQYISPELAIELGRELIEAGQQMKNWNHYETKEIGEPR